MPSTTNYGWTTPADSDPLTQGAAAIRTLADEIDTDLKSFGTSAVGTGWIPTLTGGGTNPTRQNGTGGLILGSWLRVGPMVHAWVRVVFGSTGSSGSGVLICDLPVNAATGNGFAASTSAGGGSTLGTWHVRDNSAPANNLAGSVQLAGPDAVRFALPQGGTFQLGSELNADGDAFSFHVAYVEP